MSIDPPQSGDGHKGSVFQLIIGIICMVMIANLQYGWNLFVNPIDKQHHWGRAAIQVAFSLFVLAETWLVPIEGWLVDRFGPRIIVMIGGVLVALAWAIDSAANSLPVLYFAAILGGIGAGAVYGTCVGNALKWFVGRRGLAAGITAAGFGAGAAATVVPIREIIASHGYQSAFLWLGLMQGCVILIVSQFLKAPPASALKPQLLRAGPNLQATHNFTPAETLRTPLFWVLYAMFVLVATGGLIVTAQLASIAIDFKIADSKISMIGITGTVLTIRAVGRQCAERSGEAVLRLDFRSHRARDDDVHRLHVRCRGDRRARPLWSQTGDVRHHKRAHLLHLGRDLQPVSLDLYRCLRDKIRHHQCGDALYRQGHGGASGAVGQRPGRQDRRLGDRVLDRRRHECGGGYCGIDSSQTHACLAACFRRDARRFVHRGMNTPNSHTVESRLRIQDREIKDVPR